MKRTRSVSVVVTDGGLEEARAKLSQRSRFRLAILNVLPEPWLICGASLIIVVALALASLTLFPYSLAAAGVGSSPAQASLDLGWHWLSTMMGISHTAQVLLLDLCIPLCSPPWGTGHLFPIPGPAGGH